jgi:hypothetical protein
MQAKATIRRGGWSAAKPWMVKAPRCEWADRRRMTADDSSKIVETPMWGALFRQGEPHFGERPDWNLD